MSLPPESAISNLADLKEGQIALPRLVVQRDDGLYVCLSRLGGTNDFLDFVNRVVGSGLYFRALDYPHFIGLLYDQPLGSVNSDDEIFLAADITPFRSERQALYNGLRIADGEAVYLFEPLYSEPDIDQEAPRDADQDLARDGMDHASQPPARLFLDVDEFIASAWGKGVRFGIDIAAVREGIELKKPERRVVARGRPYVPGKDAEIVEQAPGLRRNNAPRRLYGDRVDLRQFETRYPQVAAGTRLVKKVPRTAGVDGRDVGGQPLLAPLPKDFELERIAGQGTRVSKEQDGEYLMVAVCGFLNIDARTNQFSVADKIVSYEGVSARTTGDLFLTGDVYEQHGEIQERRIVQCRSITAYADVFGSVLSSGGIVCLKGNLVGGRASNDEGDIVVEGMASRATLIAQHGCINVKRADNCVIIGRHVVVGQATNCDILADEVSLEVSEACALAARTIHVRNTRSRREMDSVLLLLLPDLAEHEARIASLQRQHATLASTIADHRARIDAFRGDKDLESYLLLAGKLRRQEVVLSAEQQVPWRRLAALVAPALRTLSQLAEVVDGLRAELACLDGQICEAVAAMEQACSGVACDVEKVEGETRIRGMVVRASDARLTALSPHDLKIRLRGTDVATKLLFAGSAGQFSWIYQTPPA